MNLLLWFAMCTEITTAVQLSSNAELGGKNKKKVLRPPGKEKGPSTCLGKWQQRWWNCCSKLHQKELLHTAPRAAFVRQEGAVLERETVSGTGIVGDSTENSENSCFFGCLHTVCEE